ncbi:hypothetical protein [Rubritalea tangerina]|uniref:TF-B3 domain-containing protein n=1 Tax=Rubritalea tangerina TaxID=430798 RepID=A0ABW4ZDT3_9BACT
MADGSERPDLLILDDLEIYRGYYNSTYCVRPIETHDGIKVRFRRDQFAHIVQESSNRDGVKDTPSPQRQQRLSWIKIALQDPSFVFKAGWDNKKRVNDHQRRITVMIDNFVVVIRLKSATAADFVTCYVADDARTQEKLRNAPDWINPYT